MSPLLSVVVPFYNVEPYLVACLESVQQQTLRDFEVIMVDDGSADGSAAIAKDFTERDERFRLVQQHNQGLGPARNTGVRHAEGRYLCFLDSDDVLPRYAYELMVGSLEETGSDIVCGGVRRLTSAGPRQSPMHTEIFRATEQRAHISRRPDLLGDRTAWNKVFRREFWDRHGFEFPPGLYEDAPVTIPAHLLAKSVDVLSDVVYYWREREGEQLSITQRRTEPGNLEDRVRTVRAVAEFLHDRSPELWREHMTSVLSGELPLYVDVAGEGGPEYQERLRTLVNEVIAEADEHMLDGLTALKRLKYHLIRHGMIDELVEVLNYQQLRIFTADAVLEDGRWYAKYPYFEDPERQIPRHLYDITDEVALQARTDNFAWRDGRLYLEGHAYIARIPMASQDAGTIRVWLQRAKDSSVVELPVTRLHRPEVSSEARRTAACYDWSAFAVEIDPAALRTSRLSAKSWLRRALRPNDWRSGNWELHAEVSMPGGLTRSGPLRGPTRSDIRWANAWPGGRPGSAGWGNTAGEHVSIRPVTSQDDRFLLQVKQISAQVVGGRATGDAVELDGWSNAGATELVLARRQGMAELHLPVTTGPDGAFSARIPVDALVSNSADTALSAQNAWVSEGIDWDVSLRVPGSDKPVRLAVRDDVEVRQAVGVDEIVITRTKYGNLRMVERPRRPVVTGAVWGPDGALTLSGELAGHDRPEHLVLRWRGAGENYTVPLEWTAEEVRQGGMHQEFTCTFTPARMSRFGRRLPLASGQWGLFAPMGDGEVAVVLSRNACADLPAPRVVGIHEYRVSLYQGEALRIDVILALSAEERGVYGLKRIRQRDYPVYLAEPIRDLAMFESFRGRQYSDSPRFIYEELRRRRPDMEFVWATLDGQFPVPDGARQVLVGSREYFKTVAQARFLVGNDPMPEWLEKRPGQFYLQTWHGTPLKRIGYDIERPLFKNAQDYMRRFSKDVSAWDALVSPNPFSSPIMRRAFRFDGELLEVGYPRNDLLARTSSPEAEAIADRVREVLGLPPGKRVVLYAPTWRDDQARTGGYRMDLRIDLDDARRQLGDDHVLLVRGHFNIAEGVPGADGEFVFDVSRYPDIADLYLVADVLITDYSSVMFDFAVTGRPLLFFTYDLERYRDDLRGFYFDLEAEAPGPLCQDSAELITAIRASQSPEAYAGRYAAFREKFCPWDDGGAAARVVDRMLADGSV